MAGKYAQQPSSLNTKRKQEINRENKRKQEKNKRILQYKLTEWTYKNLPKEEKEGKIFNVVKRRGVKNFKKFKKCSNTYKKFIKANFNDSYIRIINLWYNISIL